MSSNSRSFSRFPSRSFFYRNLPIQEALTTLRYGIEARKGLVLLIGEAGLGKSTLLQKTYRELESNFIGAMTSDPRLDFTDILRLILCSLGGESASDDESALLRTCQLQLRAHAQKQQTVALILDNAQHLSESTLSRLVQTFLVTGPSSRDGHLLQMVLAGRPQFQDKLLKATHVLRGAKLPLMCELHPLEGFEIDGYIQAGLRASALPTDFFEPPAIEAIARYSQGIPCRINAICDRALQFCAAECYRKVTIELIEIVAEDLEFRIATLGDGRSPHDTSIIDTADEVNLTEFELGERDTTEVVGETFLQYNQAYDANERFQAVQPRTRFIGALVILVLVIGAGAWLQAGLTVTSLANWRDALSEILPGHRQSVATVTAKAPPEPTSKLGAMAAQPTPSAAPSAAHSQVRRGTSIEESKTGGDAAGGTADETSSRSVVPPAAHPPVVGPKVAERPPPQHNVSLRGEEIESAARQAIEMRAIDGVTVSVSDGTAILGGRVASEQQRRVAERAVRNVDGVKQVRNRIYIDHD